MNRCRLVTLVLSASSAAALAFTPAPVQPDAGTNDAATPAFVDNTDLPAARRARLAFEHAIASADAEDNDPGAVIEAFMLADVLSDQTSVRSAARFNAAAVRYREAITRLVNESLAAGAPTMPGAAAPAAPEADGEPLDLKQSLRRAERAFRAAFELDPGDLEAARNVERIRRIIRKIEAIEEEAERQRQAQQELADKLNELAEQQQQQAEQSAASDPSDQDEQQQRQGEQEDLSEQTQQAADEAEQLSQQDEQTQDALDRAREAQQEAEQALDEGKPQEAAEAQERAAEALREAADRMAEQSQQSEQLDENGEGEPKPSEESSEQDGDAEEPDPDQQLAEQLLDREQRLREQRESQLRSILVPSAPVERDW